jgi:hypothetical protein
MPSNTEFEEFCKTAIQSALIKEQWLTVEEIETAGHDFFAKFLDQCDWVIAAWRDESTQSGFGALEVLNRCDGAGDKWARCTSIPCADKHAAIKLQALWKEFQRGEIKNLRRLVLGN